MSKFLKVPLFGQFARKFHVTKSLNDIPLNPSKIIDDIVQEKHIKPLVPLMNLLVYVVIPIGSVIMWYQEYQHYVVHPHRMPWPKHDWMNSQQRPYPWGDGEKSAMFHPYYNFTKHGYITDKEGNPLPKGVYAEE